MRNKIDSFFHLFRLGQNSGHLRFQRKLYKIIRSLSLQKKLVLLLVNRRQQGRPGKGKTRIGHLSSFKPLFLKNGLKPSGLGVSQHGCKRGSHISFPEPEHSGGKQWKHPNHSGQAKFLHHAVENVKIKHATDYVIF